MEEKQKSAKWKELKTLRPCNIIWINVKRYGEFDIVALKGYAVGHNSQSHGGKMIRG